MPMSKASTSEILRVSFIIAALGVALWVLSDIVLLLFTSILVAVLLRGTAETLTHATGLPVKLSLAAVTVTILAAMAGFGFLLGPRFFNEAQQLVSVIYQAVQHLNEQYGHSFWGHMLSHSLAMGKTLNVVPMVPRVFSATVGMLGGLLLLLVTALYLSVAPKLYMNGVIVLIPKFYQKRSAEIMTATAQVLRYWMLGQLIDMAVVGILSTLGLLFLHVPLPFALGILSGLLTIIPYLGAILAGLPAVIVASTVGWDAILWVLLLYFICHIIEGYVVAPLVTRRMVHLPPALTVLSMAILGVFYGFLGVLIATPLTAGVIVLIREVYVRDVLGNE